jgi:hypothetical protein
MVAAYRCLIAETGRSTGRSHPLTGQGPAGFRGRAGAGPTPRSSTHLFYSSLDRKTGRYSPQHRSGCLYSSLLSFRDGQKHRPHRLLRMRFRPHQDVSSEITRFGIMSVYQEGRKSAVHPLFSTRIRCRKHTYQCGVGELGLAACSIRSLRAWSPIASYVVNSWDATNAVLNLNHDL